MVGESFICFVGGPTSVAFSGSFELEPPMLLRKVYIRDNRGFKSSRMKNSTTLTLL